MSLVVLDRLMKGLNPGQSQLSGIIKIYKLTHNYSALC